MNKWHTPTIGEINYEAMRKDPMSYPMKPLELMHPVYLAPYETGANAVKEHVERPLLESIERLTKENTRLRTDLHVRESGERLASSESKSKDAEIERLKARIVELKVCDPFDISGRIAKGFSDANEEWQFHEIAAGRLLFGHNEREYLAEVECLRKLGYGHKDANGDYVKIKPPSPDRS